MTRDEQRQQYRAYRQLAQQAASKFQCSVEDRWLTVRVESHADVSPVEGGAFVAAWIWVPEQAK